MAAGTPLVLGFSISLEILGIAAVGLYFIVRSRNRTGFYSEDWALAVAAVIGSAFSVCQCIGANYNIGRHIANIPPTSDPHFDTNKMVFATGVLFGPAVSITKISIVRSHLRRAVLDVEKVFYCYILTFLVCYATASTVLQIVQCTPTDAFWNYNLVNKSCWLQEPLEVGLAAVNTTTDLIVFFWPLRYIIRGEPVGRGRSTLIAEVILGAIVFSVGVIRIWRITIYSHSSDPFFEQAAVFVTAAIQLWLGVITGCVPLLAQLFDSPSHFTRNDYEKERSLSKAEIDPWLLMTPALNDAEKQRSSKAVWDPFSRVDTSNARTLVTRGTRELMDEKLAVLQTVDLGTDESIDKSSFRTSSSSNESASSKKTTVVIPTPTGTRYVETTAEELAMWSPSYRETQMPQSTTTRPNVPRPASLAALLSRPKHFNAPIRRITSQSGHINGESRDVVSRSNSLQRSTSLLRHALSSSRKERQLQEEKATRTHSDEDLPDQPVSPLPRMTSPTFYIQPGESREAELWVVNPVEAGRMLEERTMTEDQGLHPAFRNTTGSELSTQQMVTRSPSRASWSTVGSSNYDSVTLD